MAYRDEGHGTPILLIHGWGVSGDLFDAQMRGLSGQYRLLAPDLRGHGASDAFPDGAPFSCLADGIAGLIAELQLEKLCLVGWSMGAMVAFDLLQRHSGLDIAGLVLIDMVPRLLNEPGWRHGLRDGEDARVFAGHIENMLKDWRAYTALFVPRIFTSEPDAQTQQLLERASTVALANDPRNMAAIWACMAEQDFRAVLPGISLPTLVVAGLHSRLYGIAAGEWVSDQIPRARLEIFSRSGHAPHMEEPGLFNQMLSAFVHSLSANRIP
jgi:pimeloyl-ACP methyl ester carboxylesterase